MDQNGPKDAQFINIYKWEKQQKLTLENLEPVLK